MENLLNIVDWSRAQFALTACYHWLFVPLTLGLGLIVAVIETIYLRTRSDHWLSVCKFWMRLFGINFAIGVATGIILEFEFGTNWSNYSWFVGDIFGAPLAIEGIFAFFMESTFFAVMFFGWKKFSPKAHLAATWLTAFGATLSAWWILVANSWMQHPVGMTFSPEEMRNVMTSFSEVALSSVAVNKFLHTVSSGWCLGGIFVVGVAGWYLLKKRHTQFAIDSIKVGGAVGLVGILVTMATGHGSAVEVAKVQPMKLAAMEGLYEGQCGQNLVAFGILNPNKKYNDNQEAMLFDISIPYGLSILGRNDVNAFIPGIKDIIDGKDMIDGKPVNTVAYDQRIERGKAARRALADFNDAFSRGDTVAMNAARTALAADYAYFGYGWLNSPQEAVPNVAMVFYPFHIMVTLGGWIMLFLMVSLFLVFKKREWLTFSVKNIKIFPLLAIITVPLTYICSQCGWIVAEVGRQPWAIQDIMPLKAAVSSVSSAGVMTTFFIFAILFTILLVAELRIICTQIKKGPESNI
ncbi:MAG: cytochrome ubiquinol oxidase subunit I [Bacteroidaceae bacterium]|nr:cytochrome ubiquinol oxidase subunit I [Bacteroidaceae bacterium]